MENEKIVRGIEIVKKRDFLFESRNRFESA